MIREDNEYIAPLVFIAVLLLNPYPFQVYQVHRISPKAGDVVLGEMCEAFVIEWHHGCVAHGKTIHFAV